MRKILTTLAFLLTAHPAMSACGGGFGSFVNGLKAEAVQRGHAASTVDSFFAGVRQDPAVITHQDLAARSWRIVGRIVARSWRSPPVVLLDLMALFSRIEH